MTIEQITVYQLEFPLTTTYKLSSGSLAAFDPFVIEVRDSDSREGWGEALIYPGYTPETKEGAWDFCTAAAERMLGGSLRECERLVLENVDASPGAASALLSALDMLGGHPLLSVDCVTRVPLLAPCQGEEPAELEAEVAALLAEGYRTLKVKVGYKWEEDLRHVELIQRTVAGRATLRLDANRGFNEPDGKAFASRLDPRGIELFEQPCGSDDWAANAAVSAVSTVPVMLDESIFSIEDIDRAARVKGVGFVKVKLKKMGNASLLKDALLHIRRLGLTPVLGDGVSIDIACWIECCVAVHTITNAGEMNGFLKVKERLLRNPLEFSDGAVVLRPGYRPEVDRRILKTHTLRSRNFGRQLAAVPAVPPFQ